MKKIGLFSTFIEPEALTLVRAVQKAVRDGEIPDSEVAFIFSNREHGENPATDPILEILSREETPLLTLSALKFDPEMRRQGKKEEQMGETGLIWEWRNQYGERMQKLLPQTDFDLLLGDMWLWGEPLCTQRNGLNLHPALPDGPKGEWYQVIWELIQSGAKESGVMMHRVTLDLDRGPVVTLCRFSITGYPFDALRQILPEECAESNCLVKEGLTQKEKPRHPLVQEIRKHGFAREVPLILETAKLFATDEVRFENGGVIDRLGSPIAEGYDLTEIIDGRVRPLLEGQCSVRKETR